MKNKPNHRVTFSRPRDKSVESYKIWIMEIAQRLTTGKNMIELTEAEWIANWKEYWNEESNNKVQQRSINNKWPLNLNRE